jgi:hypothetical protein
MADTHVHIRIIHGSLATKVFVFYLVSVGVERIDDTVLSLLVVHVLRLEIVAVLVDLHDV